MLENVNLKLIKGTQQRVYRFSSKRFNHSNVLCEYSFDITIKSLQSRPCTHHFDHDTTSLVFEKFLQICCISLQSGGSFVVVG